MNLKRSLVSAAFASVASLGSVGSGVAAFIDWTSFDATANTATGTLNSATVSLITTVAVPNAFDINGGVTPAVTTINGSFTGYASPFFTPSIASTDVIVGGSSSSYSILFSQPVTNPTLHLWQLADTTLTFADSFTLLSSDGDFTTTANTIRGVSANPDDANGSLLFSGSFSQLSWIASNANSGDGVGLQVSATPSAVAEPGSIALLSVALTALGISRRRQRR